MDRPKRVGIATVDPAIEMVETDDGSRTLRRIGSSTTWHSESGALAESRLVYLENSGLVDRISQRVAASVLEIGFGTGLNFLLAASYAMKGGTKLNYVGIEPHLLPWNVVAGLDHQSLSECQPAAGEFLRPVFESREVAVVVGRVNLTLHESLDDLREPGRFDAIFLDPFSPEVSPGLWEKEFLQTLYGLLIDRGRLVTYCVKSDIQKRLRESGFAVRKTPGPDGGKREVLVAER